MKLTKFMRDERGAVLPLVALFLFLVALGVTALVIDVGMMYSERRTMVAAADAGALAGAQELDINSNLDQILMLSREVSIKNGADAGNITGAIQTINANRAKLDDGKIIIEVDKSTSNKYNRPYVEVTTNKNTNHFFARIFGDTDTDVKAAAVAGFNRISFEEFVFPLGAIYTDFYDTDGNMKVNTPVYFHDRKPLLDKQNWSGLLDINPKKGQGKTEIVDIVKERQIFPVADFLEPISNEDNELEVDYFVDVANGWKNFKDAVEKLINESKALDLSKRQAYLTGYIPVLKNVGSLGSSEGNVPIIILAEFVLVDYSAKIGGNQVKWLEDNYQYTITEGIISVEYDNFVMGKDLPSAKPEDTIMGYFTGETITALNAYSSEIEVVLFK